MLQLYPPHGDLSTTGVQTLALRWNGHRLAGRPYKCHFRIAAPEPVSDVGHWTNLRPHTRGTVSVEMDPLSLLSRLAASVHPPRFHTLPCGGILAAAAKWRPLVVPPPPRGAVAAPGAQDACHSLPMSKKTKARPVTHRCGYIPWQRPMHQLGIDVETCPRCGEKMKVIALVQNPASIARYFRHLDLPTEEPSMSPARGPPFWQSRVLRRRHGEPPDAGQA
jgi:hypothetical protein